MEGQYAYIEDEDDVWTLAELKARRPDEGEWASFVSQQSGMRTIPPVE